VSEILLVLLPMVAMDGLHDQPVETRISEEAKILMVAM